EETGMGIGLAIDCNSRFVYLDPYLGSQLAVAESYRNVATSGATPMGISDGLNFGSPEDPGVMWQFAEATRGLADACQELGIPVTGGNRSLYNQTVDTAIHPTPMIVTLGRYDDVATAVPSWLHPAFDGSAIYLLGETFDELDGSQFAHLRGHLGGMPPAVDLARNTGLPACYPMHHAPICSMPPTTYRRVVWPGHWQTWWFKAGLGCASTWIM